MSMRRGNNYSGPRWLFATRERPTHLSSPVDPDRTKCGTSSATALVTTEPGKVTCKNCLKKMAAQARDAVKREEG